MKNQFQMTVKLVLQKQSRRLFLLSIETGNKIMGDISTPINFSNNLQNETRLNLLKMIKIRKKINYFKNIKNEEILNYLNHYKNYKKNIPIKNKNII